MNKADVTERIKAAFQERYNHLVEILIDDYEADETKLDQWLTFFHNGLQITTKLEEKITADIAAKFPE